MTGAAASEDLFRLALNVRCETDPARFDTYFFDAGIVYVYVRSGGTPLDFLTNLVHESGHALLADTPLGFVHQSLFELAAVAADHLWTSHIERHLARAAPREVDAATRKADLDRLEAGPRPLPERQEARRTADALFERSSATLRAALCGTDARPLVAALLTLQGRREALATASRTCHEAVATFQQLSDGPQTRALYEEMAQAWLPPEARAEVLRSLPGELVKRRASLRGVWREGYRLASGLYERLRDPGAVVLAGHLAHHFPYAACDLLDMPDAEFERWRSSELLSPDLRFRKLCDSPGRIEWVAARSDGGRALLRFLADAAGPAAEAAAGPIRSFRRWHWDRIRGSACCRPIVALLGPTPPPRQDGVVDDWTRTPITPRRLAPPVLFDDGRVVAPKTELTQSVKRDFVRAVRLRTVLTILRRLAD